MQKTLWSVLTVVLILGLATIFYISDFNIALALGNCYASISGTRDPLGRSHSRIEETRSTSALSNSHAERTTGRSRLVAELPGPTVEWQGMAEDEAQLEYHISVREPVTAKFDMANQASLVIGELVNADGKRIKELQFYPGSSTDNDLFGQLSQYLTAAEYVLKVRCYGRNQATPFRLQVKTAR